MKRAVCTIAAILLAIGLIGAICLSETRSKRPAAEIQLNLVQSNQRPFLLVVVTNISSEIRGLGLDYPAVLPPLCGSWTNGTNRTEFTTSNYPFPTAGWGWPKGGAFTKMLECPRDADGVSVWLQFVRISKLQLLAGWCNSHDVRFAERVLDRFSRWARRNDPRFESATNFMTIDLSKVGSLPGQQR